MALDQYSTHVPVVAAVMLMAPAGDVLELGAGGYSTPILHVMCKMQSRKLVTIESNEVWLGSLSGYASELHAMIHAREPANHPAIKSRRWAVAFVDNGKDERKPCLDILVDNCDILIVHDTEPAQAKLYNYEPFLSQRFKSRVDLVTRPWINCHTSVLSNTVNLDVLRTVFK